MAEQDIQTNNRAGVTLALPAGRAGSVKLTSESMMATNDDATFVQ